MHLILTFSTPCIHLILIFNTPINIVLCFPCSSHFISADMARGWMYDLSRTDPRYLTGIDDFIKRARANAGDSYLVLCPCKDCKNTRKWGDMEHIRLHLITRGFMRNYTIWTLHGEVGQNINDDVPMPSVSLNALLPVHDCTEHVPTNDDVFMNTLADDTEEDDGIS